MAESAPGESYRLRRAELRRRDVVDLERDRADDADLLLDRDAPDRPAGRLVAVVTVRHSVLPQGHRNGDTGGRSDGDDDRDDHRTLPGPVAHQLTEGLAGHPV
jgi:hypothetical protein